MSTPYDSFARERLYVDLVRNERWYGWRLPVSLPPVPEDRFWRLGPGQRLADLSQKAYETPLLDWLLGDLNALPDLLDVPVGTVLRVPTRARVQLELEKAQSSAG